MKLSDLRSAAQIHDQDMSDPVYRAEQAHNRLANAVAIRLLKYRTDHGLTQKDLGRLVGMKQPHVARLELGEHEPSFATLARLMTLTGLDFTADLADALRQSAVALSPDEDTMTGLRMTTVYTIPAVDRATLKTQVDALKHALINLEDADPSVNDSTVSVDYDQGRVEVTVFTISDDFEDAKKRASRRVKEGVAKMLQQTGGNQVGEHLELVDAA